MQNTLTGQIRKLDKDIHFCKERINALYQQNEVFDSVKRNVTDKKQFSTKKSRMEKAKKKSFHQESVPEYKMKKVTKYQDNLKSKINENVFIELPTKLPKNKPRSRSASSGRDCVISQPDFPKSNQFIINDQFLDIPTSSGKFSWSNILKEHNDQKKNMRRECMNAFLIDDKKERLENVIYRSECPTKESVYVKNRGIQCSEESFKRYKTTSSSGTNFKNYNPERTLQFLIAEFRENLKNKGRDKLLSIVNDIDDALSRIKFDSDNAPLCLEPKPQEKSPYKVPSDVLHVKLAESYAKVEATCRTLEMICSKLKEEKQQLEGGLDVKNRLIKTLEEKEKHYLDQIDQLNKQVSTLNQSYASQVQETRNMSDQIYRLTQDNKAIVGLKEVQRKFSIHVEGLTKENDKLLTENQLLKLEKEKNKVLLEIKDQQIIRLKQDIQSMNTCMSNELEKIHIKCLSDESFSSSEVPICSSPNTSVGSPPVHQSWRRVSSISSTIAGGSEPAPGIQLLKQQLKTMFQDLRDKAEKGSLTSRATVSSDSSNLDSKQFLSFQTIPSVTFTQNAKSVSQ